MIKNRLRKDGLPESGTFDEYTENADEVEAFYSRITSETRQLCIRMREYSLTYAELILKSGGTNEEKYEAAGDLYDCIYDDACGEIYDAIYDDLLGDMYDGFYDGVVKDGYDYVPYREWSDASSDAYDMWSDCLSDVYDEWSDTLSDIYGFWSDLSAAFWRGDSERAEEKTEKFREDLRKIKEAEK